MARGVGAFLAFKKVSISLYRDSKECCVGRKSRVDALPLAEKPSFL